jgi:hypothetical protein
MEVFNYNVEFFFFSKKYGTVVLNLNFSFDLKNGKVKIFSNFPSQESPCTSFWTKRLAIPCSKRTQNSKRSASWVTPIVTERFKGTVSDDILIYS